MKLSFCVDCRGRLYHLRQTIRENLDAIKLDGDSEMIVLNYNSQDSMDWFMKQFSAEIKSGVLTYLHEKTAPYYHVSRAHNITHFYAKGDYVINLDSDNYIDGNIESARKIWTDSPDTVIHWNNSGVEPFEAFDGSFGRIGLSAGQYRKLGGYDEQWIPFNGADEDLIGRAKIAGYEVKVINKAVSAIYNEWSFERTGGIVNNKRDATMCASVLLKVRRENGIYEVNMFRKPVTVTLNWDKEIPV